MLEQVIYFVFVLVNEYCYEFVIFEYFLFVLMDEFDVVKVMCVCNVDLDELCWMLVEFIEDDLFILIIDVEGLEVVLIVVFQWVIQCVVIYVQFLGWIEVMGVNVLVVIFVECELNVVFFL